MAQISISSEVTLCPVDEFLDRIDENVVGQLVSDDKKQVPRVDLLDPSTVGGKRVLKSLQSGSGLLESACLLGKRYTVADLQALRGNSQSLMFDLISQVAHARLVSRRPDKKTPLPPTYEDALRMLDMIRLGERIFAFKETADAGVMSHSELTDQEIRARRGGRGDTVTQAERYFGVRY